MSSQPSPIPSLSSFLIFISGVMSATCLGLMTYTFATGKLPLGLKPMYILEETTDTAGETEAETDTDAKSDTKSDEQEGATEAEPELVTEDEMALKRPGESFAIELYVELINARQALTTKADELQLLAEENRKLAENNELLKKEIEARANNALKLVNQISDTQDTNIQRISDILKNTEINAAAKMLMEMEQDTAAKILYRMPPKSSGELITELTKDQQNQPKIKALLERFEKLSEELKP